MDFFTGLLTIILSAFAVAAAIVSQVKKTVRAVLIEDGLIRPGRPGEPVDHWPNGWHNLPDTLEGLYVELQRQNGQE